MNLGYSVGYLIVILGRQQLFTENTLTVILPLLGRRDRATLLGVARVWGVVLAANLVGVAIFTWVAASTDVLHPEVRQALAALGREAVSGGFATLFLRAIFAGWLIALMLWLLPEAETAKVPIIVAITNIVGIGGFAHVIAGTMEVLYSVMIGAAPLALLVGYVVPTFLGNVVGGVALVAVLNHAQTFGGVEE